MKNKKINIFILIVFFLILLSIITIPELIANKDASIDEKIKFIITTVLWISPISLLPLFIYNAIQRGKEKAIKESLSDIDFKNNKEYYRDILNKYSPSELSYIDNFEIDLNKEIVATILSLQLKNKITIKDSYIKIINNNCLDLKETERYILNCIKDGKVIIYNPYELEGSSKKEAVDDGLIIKNQETNNKKIKPLLGSVHSLFGCFGIFWAFIALICIFNGPVVDFLNNYVLPNINRIAPIILFIILLIMIIRYTRIFNIIFKSYYSHYKSKSYRRTELGEELNRKIEGLKNYINHFSSLNEKEKEELTLWEEYLIYSVLFNSNKKIIKELSQLIEFTK